MLGSTPLLLLALLCSPSPAQQGDSAGGVTTFCVQTKTTSIAGCDARLSVTDTSLATGQWHVTQLPRHGSQGVGPTLGMFLYSHGVGTGQSSFVSNIPPGTLCVVNLQLSGLGCGASVLPDAQPGVCNPGPIVTAMACNGGALGLAVGEDVNVQFWYRDPLPGGPYNSSLSNALFYTLR